VSEQVAIFVPRLRFGVKKQIQIQDDNSHLMGNFSYVCTKILQVTIFQNQVLFDQSSSQTDLHIKVEEMGCVLCTTCDKWKFC